MSKNIAEGIDEAEWSWLREHVGRGAVILVAPELDLAEVGRAVAGDDAARVEGWLAQGTLGKPSAAQIAGWNETPSVRFLALIVQPYVLVQQKRSELH